MLYVCTSVKNNGRGSVKEGLARILPAWLLPNEGWVVGGVGDRTEEQDMLLSPREPQRDDVKTGFGGLLQGTDQTL